MDGKYFCSVLGGGRMEWGEVWDGVEPSRQTKKTNHKGTQKIQPEEPPKP